MLMASLVTGLSIGITLQFGASPTGQLPAAFPPTEVTKGEATWPVAGFVYRFPDIPWPDWNSGHRGIDIAITGSDLVYSPTAAEVVWVGAIGGESGISLTDDFGYRHTLMHLTSELEVGDSVVAGDVIGVAQNSGHCGFEICIHWSVRQGEKYLDPRWFVCELLVLLP
ncbi:MAG: hypothetical protein RL038_597 [Actinomycetota bacterium]